MSVAKLLEIRKSRNKPNFQVQNSNDRKKRFPGRWKRPKGLQSKMRERRRGNPKYIEPGYGAPAAIRGATADGLFPVVVSNAAQLDSIRSGQGVVIASVVGMRKRAEIAAAAAQKKLPLINFKADKVSADTASALAARKKRRQEILQKRKLAPEAKKAAEPSGVEAKVDEEERKKLEKAEKDKVLIKAK